VISDTASGAAILVKEASGETPDVLERRVGTQAMMAAARTMAEQLSTAGGQADTPDEGSLFMALRTCAYHAEPGGKAGAASHDTEAWAERWKLVRDYIVEQNLGLAYSIVGRFRAKDVDWDELRSEAFLALIRAVEGFNPWRGFRFSTYACNAIMRSLVHLAKKANKYRLRFPVEHDASFERPGRLDGRSDLFADRLNRALDLNLGELTDQETLVIGWRFPLGGGLGRTLGEVGDAMGLSKERVRQIQKSALEKLRQVLEADPSLQ
jgi:RNA polymerase primary sigma factor